MAAVECAIWKTPAQLLESAGEFQVFDSPRAGGKYWISGTSVGEILPFTDHAKRLLTTWICEQRRAGAEIPKVRSQVLELIKSRQDTSLNDLHFDTRQYSHIVWKNPADLLVQLKNRIGATIGDGPLPKL